MRILILANQWSPDRRSGYARVVGDTARALARRGHDVTAVVPRVAGLPQDEADGRLRVLRVVRQGRLPVTLTDPLETRRTARRLRAQDFDVVMAHSTTNAVPLGRAWRGVPLVLVYHASGPREMRYNRPALSGPRRLAHLPLAGVLEALERLALRRASRVVVLSDFTRSLLEADHPEVLPRVRLTPGAVDVDWFSPGAGRDAARATLGVAADEPLLLTVRRLEPRMGIEHLLSAVSDLRADEPVQLVVAGRGSLDEPLREMSERLGLDRRVRFLGGVSDDDLREWYRAADLFVLPTAAYEGFGIATVEALACGVPVVGTPVGATPELLAPLDPRLVAGGSDPEALREVIQRAIPLSGPALRERCRDYALERYSWDAVAPAWERALDEAVAG